MGLTEHYWQWAALRFAGGVSSVAGLLLASAFVLRWLAEQGYQAKLGLHFIGIGAGIALPGLLIRRRQSMVTVGRVLALAGHWRFVICLASLVLDAATNRIATAGDINAVARQQCRPTLVAVSVGGVFLCRFCFCGQYHFCRG